MMNIKKNMILFHEPDVFKMFNNAYTEDDYKKLFIKHSRILFAIDFIIVLLNSTVVLGLYFDTETEYVPFASYDGHRQGRHTV